MRDGPRARQRGDRERHRHAVVACASADAAGRRARAADDEAVRPLVGVDAERAEPGDQRGNPVALLDAQLGGAPHGHLAAVRRERRDRRQFVDQARHFLGRDLDGIPARSRLDR